MSIEGEQFDPKNATSVAEWYLSVMVKRGYEVDFTLNDISLLDRYCEEVLWEMDQSTELFFKEQTAFEAYIGEVMVRNTNAIWIGNFDLYTYMANYYETAIAISDKFVKTPGRLTYKVSNKSPDESIAENVRETIEEMNEIQPV